MRTPSTLALLVVWLCLRGALPLAAQPAAPDPAWAVARAVLRPGSAPTPARVELVRGIAVRRGADLRDGTIEFDLATPEGRGTQFAGVTFRMASTADYEVIYFQSNDDGTRWSIVQYQPVYEGETTWQLYPGDGYEARLPRPDDVRAAPRGLHVRLVVSGTRADLYVDSARAPLLRVRELKRDPAAGAVGVWAISPDGAASVFDHVAVRETVDGPPGPVAPLATPPGQLLRWSVSARLPSPDGVTPPRALSRELRDALGAGHVVEAEPSGLVNLTRALGNPAGRQAANVFGGAGWGMALARVTLTSDRPQVVRLRFGYSDGVGVFLDGRSLFVGRNDYDSRYKGYIATMNPEADALDLPLHAGQNELVLVVTDRAFGWGFAARLEDPSGITATP